jgi:hypothetical protein
MRQLFPDGTRGSPGCPPGGRVASSAVEHKGGVVRLSIIAWLVAGLPGFAVAQWSDYPAFSGAAVLLGAQGFARPPITSAMAGAYAYHAVGSLLIGGQGSTTFGDGDRSRGTYALATVGWAQSRALAWQFYPFLGAGAAAFRTVPGRAALRPAFGAGFGADGLITPHRLGVLAGARIGYVTRSLGDDESVAYAALTLGIGGRRTPAAHITSGGTHASAHGK